MNRMLLSATTCMVAFLSTGAMAAPSSPKPLSPRTRANLEAAMHGEAYANLKYLRYADQAAAAGKPTLAKLFRESANIEANEHDVLPRNHAIGKLARQMETSDAARPIYRGSDHWRAARA